jgi:CBS domain-containing protein
VEGVTAWLGYINLFLLAFNLLPALPLDGGRVLRAALWARKRDYARATIVAADIGRGLAYLMIGVGLALFIGSGAFGGIWLAFLGWFVLAAATSESRYLAVRQALAGVRVRQLMVPEPVTADAEQTLGAFMDRAAGHARYTAYPVVRDGDVVGVLPLRRVLQTPPAEWGDVRVGERMLPRADVPTFREDDDALQALLELGEGDLHRGLVLADGRLAGFISITNIARLLAEQRPGGPALTRR